VAGLGLQSPGAAHDFLDNLVALGFLDPQRRRPTEHPENGFSSSPRANAVYVGRKSSEGQPSPLSVLEPPSERTATGLPQNELRAGGEGPCLRRFMRIPPACRNSLASMTGISHAGHQAHRPVLPVDGATPAFAWMLGTAQGDLAAQIANASIRTCGVGF